jgi:hypothetical protein
MNGTGYNCTFSMAMERSLGTAVGVEVGSRVEVGGKGVVVVVGGTAVGL